MNPSGLPPMSRDGEVLQPWSIAIAVGAVPVRVEAEPDRDLQRVEAGSVTCWRGLGENPGFTLALSATGHVLPAGWYLLEGSLVGDAPGVMMPCLHPGYAKGADGEARIALPVPGSGGRIRMLVLFKYDVSSLRFLPGAGSTGFGVGAFSLRRVSRLRALVMMLGPGTLAPARVPGFGVRVLREGLSRATDRGYRAYQRRCLPPDPDDYAGWAARFDTLGDAQMQALRDRVDRLGPDAPVISVLVPLYQTPERWLRRCIESVLAQVYPKWELCLVDDASPDSRVGEIAREYGASDERIRFVRRPSNGHISESSNTALGIATGEYVALLDHDDELRPHALLEVAEAITSGADVALVYSDEDKIDEAGRRFDPYFKPDWDPDLLRSQNYLCHLTTIRASLVREVGGFRTGFEGSQDHDLVLRCTERLEPGQIRHVPKVLYHWRAIPGSTALSRDAKDYASSAGARAVAGHLQRSHPGAGVDELSHGHYRVRWPLPVPAPKVSLVVPTRDRVELLRMCVQSVLERTEYPDFEVVIVDNGSRDPAALAYLQEVRGRQHVRVLRYDAPFNYSQINNWAVSQCDGQVVGLLNNDIEVISPGWLEEMVSHAMRPDVGAVGAMLYYPNDTIQHAGVVLGVHGVAAHLYSGMPRGYPGHGGRARVVQSLSAVTGACLVVRRELYDQVGGLDERLAVAFNDVDFCLRLWNAGYRSIWTPFAELYHHESASRGSEDTEEKKLRFSREVETMMERWAPLMRSDPAYNPNLSLQSLTCALAVPPRAPTFPGTATVAVGPSVRRGIRGAPQSRIS